MRWPSYRRAAGRSCTSCAESRSRRWRRSWTSSGQADLIITEGYKAESHAKIEVRNLDLDHPELAGRDKSVIAVAASGAIAQCSVPVFRREDVTGIAAFVVERLGLERK